MTALACVRIPNIAIALARRADPALSDQPLVLYSREGGRTIVYAASDNSGAAPGR